MDSSKNINLIENRCKNYKAIIASLHLFRGFKKIIFSASCSVRINISPTLKSGRMIYRTGHLLTWISKGKTIDNHMINLQCQEVATEQVKYM